jgi:predicted Rdx family selenoprotein
MALCISTWAEGMGLVALTSVTGAMEEYCCFDGRMIVWDRLGDGLRVEALTSDRLLRH